jgi:SHS2 domain-containing protein
MPFEELPHTADWALRVWAADLVELFLEAARGMNAQAGIILANEPRVMRTFSASAADAESLLVSFLSELLYTGEQDHLAFDQIDLRIDQEKSHLYHLDATLRGAHLLSSEKAIKAVTFHNLQIRKTGRGFEVEIVFDV